MESEKLHHDEFLIKPYKALPSPWKNLAEEETGENEEKVNITLPKLRQMITNDERLQCPLTDEFLLRFLRYRHFDCDKAFLHAKNYCEMARDYPVLFKHDIPSFLKRIGPLHMPMLMSKKLENGYSITIARSGAWDPSIATIDDMLSAVIIVTEYLMRLDRLIQSIGVVFLVDCQGLGLHHVRHVTPSVMQRGLRWMQDCTPLLHSKIHVVNTPVIFDVIYTLFSRFASKELRKKLVLHGKNLASLHKHIPKSHLPEEYGGTDGVWDAHPLIDEIIKRHVEISDALNIGYLD